ncbi:MAG: sigma-70 family RNA polymerase sigma factor [Candidatus Nanopelagicales bacterium]
MVGPVEVAEAVERAHREEWGIVLAAVARLLDGDLATSEECTQEAFVAALETWGARGVPDRPGAWLTTTARRRALDRVRREAGMRARYPDLVRDEIDHAADPAEEEVVVVDDRLRLVFTCCHPSLAPESRVALTLRMVCGLATSEIARAFLVPEPTMAARITRAKKKITAAGVPYRVPYGSELPDRLDAVLTVIHLVFTTGHAAQGASVVRADLVDRALDLARVLAVLMPDEPEALGLLALLELTDARRDARAAPDGSLVLLEEQDRSRWDRAQIEHGSAMLDRALLTTRPGHPPGRFTLQAAIAAAHADASTWDATDWLVILALYDRLLATWPTPVVAVNRAVALSFASGPEAGLAALDPLRDDPALRAWHYLPAARADLLRRAGRLDEASSAYAEALALVPDGQERRFLERRADEVRGPRRAGEGAGR